MKKIVVLIACLALIAPGMAFSFDISGWESANKDRGQWAWFTGQAQKCDETIPVPGSKTRAEWETMLTSESDLPCEGAGLSQRTIKHIYLFLNSHASDSDDPMNQKPESCG
ncbi:MAG TPA: hypothetical protein VKN62_01540 [Pelovirga sp.]|nr:hypothetical protein [Pelovirga sp.]